MHYPQMGSPGDLREVAERCSHEGWAWIRDNLDLFAPVDPFDPDELQRLTELALLYSFTRQWSGPEESRSPTLEAVGDFLLGHLADPVIAQHARRRLVMFSAYFTAYLALRPLGHRIDAYEEGLAVAERAGYPDSLEANPYRELEIQHVNWKGGLRAHRPQCDGVYSGTVLARIGNPVHLTTPTVYSVTHTLFYLNDFSGPSDVMPAAETRRTVDIVEALFVHYWRKRDWDLLSELALNLVSLDRHHSPQFLAGAGALFRAWESEPDGALPGRTFDPEKADPERDYRFTHAYHTTLVATLFSEAYLYRLDAGWP
jgi:hypothetical protein